jgi:Kef-type K+ transport system membrane component KefB
VRRELTPVGHLFIPVFFLQIGIDADIDEFRSATVLRDASLLLLVGVAGKLVSALVLRRGDGDRWLIGTGMIPRGEVGLIFANVGAGLMLNGAPIIDSSSFSAVVAMVVVTTMVTPPALKWSLSRPSRRPAAL